MTSASPFGARSVRASPELGRIASLPRRAWTDADAARLAELMTAELRTPRGTMKLRPVQAVALYELMEAGGLFGPISVGEGKTLLSLLAPVALDAKRPVLLLPAALIDKTWHERTVLAEHWRLATNLQLISYEMLGLVQAAGKLEYIQPDLIIADECHRLKRYQAGRTRRVIRYMREHPDTKFVAVSGTVMRGSVLDFAHLLRWCLKDGAPIPATDEETGEWADALDEKVNPLARRSPSALFAIGSPPLGEPELTAARKVFQSRLLETRGVVASSNADAVACSLRISALDYEPSPETVLHIANMKGLNDDPTRGIKLGWTTPDGWTFATPLEMTSYIRQLSLGFHLVWSPRPPPEWIKARRAWAEFVRETIEDSDALDTELQVANAVDSNALGFLAMGLLSDWRHARKSFTIDPQPVWHDDTALSVCCKWMEREKGIVWCEHVAFAERLSELSGCAYYGADGLSRDGKNIVHVEAGAAIICSRQANSTGRNLQMFSRNLITCIMPSADTNEQLIGRTHRQGQQADEVLVDVLCGCKEHYEAFFRARSGAEATRDVLGHAQKLLLADICFPTIESRTGPLWV